MNRLAPTVYDAEPIPAAALAEVEALLHSGDLFRYTRPADQPTPVALLEKGFAEMMGAKYALALNSCSSAIFLALKCLDVRPEDQVLIPAFTFAAVPSAVVHAGATPVLVEVGDNYRIDMTDFEAKLTPSVKAIVISHMRGHTSDMDAILKLAKAHDLPVIEDAAHSLGTLWHGDKIGTLGKIGCFSFQSYKMINAGEGGIMITDDADLVARAVIMSGAYEHNWKKHKGPRGDNTGALEAAFGRWQNQLPLYNLRMSNLSAAVIRPQLPELLRRVRDGRANHDHVAAKLNSSPFLSVPDPLGPEVRAPDSIQFNLVGLDEGQTRAFAEAAGANGVKVQVFGLSADNARAFWNWQFIADLPELPQTRAMLMQACDVRLPVYLKSDQLDAIAEVLIGAAAEAAGPVRAFGT